MRRLEIVSANGQAEARSSHRVESALRPRVRTAAAPSPNPARAALTLRFALPRAAGVELSIYDATGRRVRELASGSRAAGEYTIGWDLRDQAGRKVGAGIFFARLAYEGQVLTRRFVTLR